MAGFCVFYVQVQLTSENAGLGRFAAATITAAPPNLSLNSVITGVSAFCPIILWLGLHITDPGDRLDILQAEFYRGKQAQRSPMIYHQRLSVKVSRKQRLLMPSRRQVNRHEIRVGPPGRVQIYR